MVEVVLWGRECKTVFEVLEETALEAMGDFVFEATR
jgi:hypothetical protein